MSSPKTTYCRRCQKRIREPHRWCEECRENQAMALKKLRKQQIEENEPTMEELEALIAERMKNLPAWWYTTVERDDIFERKPKNKGPRKKKRAKKGIPS